jgi:hypothetical protein
LPCLVFDKGAKLVESPSAHLRPLLLAKPCPVADALEIFQGHSTSGVFSLGNERFRNDVVDILAKARFAPCKEFELAPDVLRAQAAPFAARCRFLKTAAQSVVVYGSSTFGTRVDLSGGMITEIAG